MTRLAWLRERGMGASILVAALSSAFGVILIVATGYIGAVLFADEFIGGSETLAVVVGIMTVLLVGVAVYVAAIVTANTFATIVAGRVRNIALMRLIGASARRGDHSKGWELVRGGALLYMTVTYVVFALLLIFPLLYAFGMSLFTSTLATGTKFTGIDNYMIGPNGPTECLHRTPKQIFEVL